MKPTGHDSGEPLETGQNKMTAAYLFRQDLSQSADKIQRVGRYMELRPQKLSSNPSHARTRKHALMIVNASTHNLSRNSTAGVRVKHLEKLSKGAAHTDMHKCTHTQMYTHKRTPAIFRGTAQWGCLYSIVALLATSDTLQLMSMADFPDPMMTTFLPLSCVV